MMRRLAGLMFGFVLFFPGALFLEWLVVDVLSIYQEMALTDALLAMIIIVAGVIIVGQPKRTLTAEELEAQAAKMELASRRLEKAQRQHAQAVRAQRLNRRSASSRSGSASRRASGSSTSARTLQPPRPPRSSRGDRRRRR